MACSSVPKLREKASCCVVVELLVAEDQHGVAVHPVFHRAHVDLAQGLSEIDALDITDEIGTAWVCGLDLKRHGWPSPGDLDWGHATPTG